MGAMFWVLVAVGANAAEDPGGCYWYASGQKSNTGWRNGVESWL